MNLRALDLIVPPDIRNLLSIIQKSTSFACVAGGYLRDSYYGIPQKDFVSIDCDRLKLIASLDDWTPNEDNDEDDYQGGHISDIIDLIRPNHLPVQIIVSDKYTSVTSVLETFDFGICQVAYSDSNVLISDAFWKDAANDTITFVGKGKSNPAHTKRLMEKFPSVKWVWS